MTSPTSWRRLGLAGVVLALTAGCGAGPPAAEREPKLVTSLDRVDAAIAEGDDEAARTRLDELVSVVTRARESGRLDAEQAGRILDAAARLQSALPEEPPPAEPAPVAPTPESEPAPTETSAPGTGTEHEGSDEHGGKADKGKAKGRDD